MYRAGSIAAIFLIILGSQAVNASGDPRFGYMSLESVFLDLDHGTATYHLTYRIDDGMRFLFLFIGLNDLENRVLALVNEQSGEVTFCDAGRADVVVWNGTAIYGKGMYYYPKHTFMATIPNITVRTPQGMKYFRMTDSVPEGIGYYQQI